MALKDSSIKEDVLRRSIIFGTLPYLSTSESDNFLGVSVALYLELFGYASPENSVATSRWSDCVCLDILNLSRP